MIEEPFSTTLRRGRPLVWSRGSGLGQRALLGWGERFRAEAHGVSRFAELEAAFARFAAGHCSEELTAFVTVAFSPDSQASSLLIVPEVLGRYEGGRLQVPAGAELDEPGEAGEFAEVDLLPGHLTRATYRRAVERALAKIAEGEVGKVVIARDLLAASPDPIDVPALLARLAAANPDAWTFQVGGMVGASPELLVARAGRSVFARVLAGSAPGSGGGEADERAAAELERSAKDSAEHAYAAESVAGPLSQVASITVSQPRALVFPTIVHLATDITGALREDVTALGLAGRIHPSAAICGTPTAAAAQLLAELEGFDRGRYAGPVGWLNSGGDGEFAIALRCGQLSADSREIRLFAGGGIVAGSEPSSELAETAQKFLPVYQALSPVARP